MMPLLRRLAAVPLAAVSFAATPAAALDTPALAAGLDVLSTSPAPYALHVPASTTEITVQFDLAPAAPPAGAVRVCGTMSGLHPVVANVAGTTMTITVSGAWQPGELVNVNLHRDVSTGGGASLDGGYYFAFTVAAGAGPRNFHEPVAYGAANVPYFLFGGDLDGDGHPDLAAPNEGTDDFSIWLNPLGTGQLGARSDYGVGSTPSSCFGEDFDNDGDLDLATADIGSGTMSVALNNGDGTFAPSVAYAAGTTTRQVFGGDFDGDNDVDLAATSRSTDQVFLYYNDGSGTFVAAAPYTDVQDGPFAVEAGDYNRDGWLDLAVASQATSAGPTDSLAVLLNDGQGGFATAARWHAGDGPWDLAANDMDGDGDCDLASVTSFNNRVHVMFNDGSAGFAVKNGFASISFPLGVGLGDLDGDGDLDVLSANFNGASIGVYENDGLGGLALDATLGVNRSGSFAWASDLDGDGDLDVSAVDELSDTLYVFLNEPPVSVPLGTNPGDTGPRLVAQPNPAPAAGTTIRLVGLEGRVTVDVLAVDGSRIRRLFEGDALRDGSIGWDGRDSAGRPLPAGAYVLLARGAGGSASEIVRLIR
ncbi:MAG: FG-GAP-like repeat-containing protein [Candidatus Eiseniibacteriota bacterium]